MDITFDRAQQGAANSFMAALEADFLAATGARGRQDYSAFYGPCVPSPLLVLGTNPGGSEGAYRVVDVTRGEHEYVEGHGPTSANLGRLLQAALGASSPEGIRGVQGSNVIWRRSPNLAALGMPPARAAAETRPFLERLVRHVRPQAILFAGGTAANLFTAAHGARERPVPEDTVMGPNGASQAVYFARSVLALPYLGHEVEAFTVLHPCKGLRDVAVDRLRAHFRRLFG